MYALPKLNKKTQQKYKKRSKFGSASNNNISLSHAHRLSNLTLHDADYLARSRQNLIRQRERTENLSVDFLRKARIAIDSQDENAASECLRLFELQKTSAENVKLLVDNETTSVNRLRDDVAHETTIKFSTEPLIPSINVPKMTRKREVLKTSQLPSIGLRTSSIIDSWNDSLGTEASSYESIYVHAESRLQSTISQCRIENSGTKSLHPALAAVLGDLLLKLEGGSARFNDFFKLLRVHLLNSIYGPKPDFSDPDFVCTAGYLYQNHEPLFVTLERTSAQLEEATEKLSMEARGVSLKEQLGKKNAGINLMFNKGKQLQRRMIFRVWARWVLEERARRKKFDRLLLRNWFKILRKAVWISVEEEEGDGDGERSEVGNDDNNSGKGNIDIEEKKHNTNTIDIDTGGKEHEGVTTDIGSTPEERKLQKSMRRLAKENQAMKKKVAEMISKQKELELELEIAYEICSELDPNHDVHDCSVQSEAIRKHEEIKLIDNSPEASGKASKIGLAAGTGKLMKWRQLSKKRLEDHLATNK